MDEKIAKDIFDNYCEKNELTKDKLKNILNLLEFDLSNNELLKDLDKMDNNINFKDFYIFLDKHNKCTVTLTDIRNKLNSMFDKNVVDIIITKVYPNNKNTDEVDPTKILESLPDIPTE